MSTFVRAGSGSRQASFGSGVPSLDAAFMPGGVPSGTLVGLVEEVQRRSRGVALGVLRCFAAEGVAAGQAVLIVDSGAGGDALLGSLSFLPTAQGQSSKLETASGITEGSFRGATANSGTSGNTGTNIMRTPKSGSFRAGAGYNAPAASKCCSATDSTNSGCCSQPSGSSNSANGASTESKDSGCCSHSDKSTTNSCCKNIQPSSDTSHVDDGLRIAWRYAALPTTPARMGERSYDSGRRMDVASACTASGSVLQRHCIDFGDADWESRLSDALAAACLIGNVRGTRIVIPSLGAPHWPSTSSLAVLRAVRRVSSANNRTCAALATIAPCLGRNADVAGLCSGLLAAVGLDEPAASGGKPVQVAALRVIVPVRQLGALAGHVPACAMAAVLWGGGRVMRVEPLYIPPEDGPSSSCGASVEF